MNEPTGEYVVWYLPYETSAETLSRTYNERNLPPYDLREDEIIDFILNEIWDIGDPFEIRRVSHTEGLRIPGPRLWHNKSWGID